MTDSSKYAKKKKRKEEKGNDQKIWSYHRVAKFNPIFEFPEILLNNSYP